VEDCINQQTPALIKLGTSFQIMFHYICKVVLPYPLSFYYGYEFIHPQKISDPIPLISLIIHLILIISAIVLIKRNRPISLGIFIYLISISIFANYLQMIPGMVGDRFLLLPSLGWITVFTFLILKLFSINIAPSSKSPWQIISSGPKFIFIAVLLLYSVLSFSRNMDWRDYLTLFRHDIKYVDNSAQAHNLLAIRLVKSSFDNNDPNQQTSLRQEALLHFKKAITIYPEFFNVSYDIARTYNLLNMPDSAIASYKRAIKLNPGFDDCYLSIGDLLFQQQKVDEAIPYFEFFINKYPDKYIGYDKVSYLYFFQKNYSKAIELNKTAITKMPNIPNPYITLGKIYQQLDQKDSSRVWLRKALEVSPGNDQALTLLKALGS
jgi:tetratricopeptide (TPR) repeat protein